MNKLQFNYWKWILRFKYGLHLNKPMYQLKFARNLLRAKYYRLFKKNTFQPRSIDFAITYKCNFNCEDCYAKKLIKTEEMLTPEDYKFIAQQARDLGFITFSFQGGEPFLRKDWPEIIKAFQPKKYHITITTNASVINSSTLIRCKELGVDTMYYSLDGWEEQHDKFRTPGNFKKVMEMITWTKRVGMKVAVNTVVSKDNLYTDGFKRLLDFTHGNRIMTETIYARPLGNWEGEVKLMLDAKDIEYYYKLRENYPFVVRDLDNNYYKWGCPAVKEVLYISAYGDVMPCPYSHISLGNLKKEVLSQIWSKALKSKWYNHYHWECLTALDKKFIGDYLPKIKEKPVISLEELENR